MFCLGLMYATCSWCHLYGFCKCGRTCYLTVTWDFCKQDRTAVMFLAFPVILLVLKNQVWNGCFPALPVQVYQVSFTSLVSLWFLAQAVMIWAHCEWDSLCLESNYGMLTKISSVLFLRHFIVSLIVVPIGSSSHKLVYLQANLCLLLVAGLAIVFLH